MDGWSFLSNHGRVLLCLAHDPGMRLRDIAASLAITERSAYGIVADLTQAGYVVKQKCGRRNQYEIQAHLPLPERTSRERTVGEVLALLAGSDEDRLSTARPSPGVASAEGQTGDGTHPQLVASVGRPIAFQSDEMPALDVDAVPAPAPGLIPLPLPD
jgi:IclR helix-turn-helix domain